MKLYDRIEFGEFICRPNRFIAQVKTEHGMEICHVKNTGRCRELLVPGAQVTLAVSKNPERKTRCDLVAVKKGELYINMDSQAPNLAAGEALPNLFPGLTLLRPETFYGESRLDFYVEQGKKKTFVEVKGVTLEENGVAYFPDAPTERGIKHLKTLEMCKQEGYGAALLLVIQMRGIYHFEPNRKTHPAFADALLHASKAGVQIMAFDCVASPDSLTLCEPVPVILE